MYVDTYGGFTTPLSFSAGLIKLGQLLASYFCHPVCRSVDNVCMFCCVSPCMCSYSVCVREFFCLVFIMSFDLYLYNCLETCFRRYQFVNFVFVFAFLL